MGVSPTQTAENAPKYWDRALRRKTSPNQDGEEEQEQEQRTVLKEARILSLSDPNDDANKALHSGELPEGATLLAVGTSFEEFDIESLKAQKPNVIFVSHPLVRFHSIEALRMA